MSARNAPIGRKLRRLLRAFAALIGLAGVTLIALQCLWWFEDGYWTPKSPLDLWLWLGNSYSPMSSSGMGRVVLWALDLPLGAVLVAIALCVFWLSEQIDF
jgi:hypothetical protein